MQRGRWLACLEGLVDGLHGEGLVFTGFNVALFILGFLVDFNAEGVAEGEPLEGPSLEVG